MTKLTLEKLNEKAAPSKRLIECDVDYLNECLMYFPFSGRLVWRERPQSHFGRIREWKRFNTRFSGTYAGSESKTGYLVIKVDAVTYQAHRIAYAIKTGRWPDSHIDHVNHVRTDNRWVNLTDATFDQNMKNRARYSTNTSGQTGVSYRKDSNRWEATIKVNKKTMYLGRFKGKSAAIRARKLAEREHGFHENHGK